MKLADYLSDKEIIPTEFARRLGVEASTVTRLVKGERRPSLGLAVKIERETEGLVGLKDWAGSAPEEPADQIDGEQPTIAKDAAA